METKVCTKCNRELPLNMFAKYTRRNHTHYSSCKECKAKYRQENKRKLYDNASKVRLSTEEYKIKARAWNKIHYAIKVGKILKPSQCSICGGFDNIQAHHNDYSKPYEVQWVCQSCHSQLDKIRKAV